MTYDANFFLKWCRYTTNNLRIQKQLWKILSSLFLNSLKEDLWDTRYNLLPVCILMCLVNSSLLENRRSHSFTGQPYGRSWTGVLLGRLGYFRALTGINRIGIVACWYTYNKKTLRKMFHFVNTLCFFLQKRKPIIPII